MLLRYINKIDWIIKIGCFDKLCVKNFLGWILIRWVFGE